MSMDKLGTFCTLFNANNWEQYQAEAKQFLLVESPGKQECRVEFAGPPKSYPCLVAGSLRTTDPTKANQFTYYRVECCFVYLTDAHRLLGAAASVDDSIIVEDEDGSSGSDNLSSFDRAADGSSSATPSASPYGEADLTILVFAMLKELHSIGAIKFERLQEELPKVQSALEVYEANQPDEPVNLSECVASLWRYINAD